MSHKIQRDREFLLEKRNQQVGDCHRKYLSKFCNINMKPLHEITQSSGVRNYQKASDTQLYILLSNPLDASIMAVNQSFKAVLRWFTQYNRKLNPGKAEMISWSERSVF